MDEQIKELTNHVMNLRIELGKIDTKMDSIKDMQHKVDDHSARITAVESSAASAHHRLNAINKVLLGLSLTGGGAIVTAVVTFIVKGGLVK